MLCKFCNSPMDPMRGGSITILKSSQDCIHSALAGDTLKVSEKDWECPNCDSKLISSVSPTSGVCLAEAPQQLVYALRKFADRLRSYVYSEDLLNELGSTLTTSELSESRSANLDELESNALSHWTHVGVQVQLYENPDYLEGDHDLRDLSFYDARHKERGDSIEIEICRYITLRLFFDGGGEVELLEHQYERRFATEKIDSGDYSDHRESYWTSRKPINLPIFANLEAKLDSLICGTDLLYELAIGMTGIRCDNEFCPTHAYGEDSWEEFKNFMLYELDYLTQEGISERMSKKFPMGNLREIDFDANHLGI